MLDVQVWVSPSSSTPGSPDDHDTLGWTFFQKPSAARRVLLASSAYNWRSKIVTLNMEVFRRMKNCSRQLTPDARVDILKRFVDVLRASGYVEKSVEGIIKSGLKFYERKVMIDLQGGPPLYERSEAGTLRRRRQKLGATEQWFSRRRGGDKEREVKDQGWRREKRSGAHRREGPGAGGPSSTPPGSLPKTWRHRTA